MTSRNLKILALGWLMLLLIAPFLAVILLPALALFYIRQKYYTQIFVICVGGLILWVVLNAIF
jgi:hypothetical protein